MTQDNGAPADAGRATAASQSNPSVSSKAGIPSAWAVLNDYSYSPVEIIRETKSSVFFKAWNSALTDWRERRSQSALNWRGTEAEARELSAKLCGLRDEKYQRITAVNKWFREQYAALIGDSQ